MSKVIRLHHLPNGFRLLTVVTPGRKTAYFKLFLEAGLADEAADAREVSHLTEHLVWRRLTESLRREPTLTYAAARVNASTENAATEFYGDCHRRHLPATLARLAAALDLGKMTAADLKAERHRVRDEFFCKNRSHAAVHSFHWLAAHYGHDRRYAPFTIAAAVAAVDRLDLEAARAFAERFYVGPGAVLALAGDFDADAMAALAGKIFHWVGVRPAARQPLAPPATGLRLVSGRRGRANVSVTWIGPPLPHRAWLALQPLRRLLDEFLETGLEADLGLYSSEADFYRQQKFSALELAASVRAEDVGKTTSRMRGEIRRFLDFVTDEAWRRAVAQELVTFDLETDFGASLAADCVARLRRYGRLITPADEAREIRRVGLAAAKRTLAEMIARRPNVIVTHADSPWPDGAKGAET